MRVKNFLMVGSRKREEVPVRGLEFHFAGNGCMYHIKTALLTEKEWLKNCTNKIFFPGMVEEIMQELDISIHNH